MDLEDDMATDAEIEAATRVLRDGDDWATCERVIIALDTAKVETALDAAAAVRAEVGTGGMEIIRAVAAIPLWADTHLTGGPDILGDGSSKISDLTPAIVRQARAIVAAAERKEVMPNSSVRSTAGSNNPSPPTAGPIPEAGARNGAPEDAAELCEIEAHRCLGDIVAGDSVGAKLAHARAGALMTVAGDIRALKSRPSPPSGSRSKEGVSLIGYGDESWTYASLSPSSPAPDVAGLVTQLRKDWVCLPDGLLAKAAVALTDQAAELAAARASIGALWGHLDKARDDAAASLWAKEAEIERLRVKEAGIEAAIAAIEPDARDLIADINARIESGAATEIEADCRDALRTQATALMAKEADHESLRKAHDTYVLKTTAHIAALEAALRPFAKEAERWPNQKRGDHFRPYDGEAGENMDFTVGDLRHARAALAGKEPQQP